MNDKGQTALYALMLCVILVVLGLALSPALSTVITDVRNTTRADGTTGLDCDNSSISDFDKGTCEITDLTLPYFIGIIIGIGILVLGATIIIGGNDE